MTDGRAEAAAQAMWERLYEQTAQIVQAEITRLFGNAFRGGKWNRAYIVPPVTGEVRCGGADVTIEGVAGCLGYRGEVEVTFDPPFPEGSSVCVVATSRTIALVALVVVDATPTGVTLAMEPPNPDVCLPLSGSLYWIAVAP